MIVVLAIMGLAAMLVLPALRTVSRGDSGLQTIVPAARAAAAHRGELIYLRIEADGAWHMEGGGSPLEGELTGGRINPVATVPLTLIISPVGSCAFDVRSATGAPPVLKDPLTCEIATSR